MSGARRTTAAAVLLPLLAITGCSSTPNGSTRSAGSTHSSAGSTRSSALAPLSITCAPLRPRARPHPGTEVAQRVKVVSDAVAAHGWNPQAPAFQSPSPGGMYVNWRSGWDGSLDPAANTNIQTSGRSDAQAGSTPRHDPLNDLLILRDLDAYLATGAVDPGVATLRCRLQPIVEAEFAHYGVYRGWVYFELIDLSELDPDAPWAAAAQAMAQLLSTHFIDPISHGIVDPRHGTYTSSDAAGSAAALVDAGARFARPEWTAQGEAAAIRLVTAAADQRTGLFPDTLTSQAQSVRDRPSTTQMRVGAQAQLLDALLTVYDAGHQAPILAAVLRAVGSLLDPAVGIVDNAHGGFYFAMDLSSGQVRRDYKETRQAWMIPLLEHLQRDVKDATGADSSTAASSALVAPQALAGAAASMSQVVLGPFYQRSGQGYVYRLLPDWSPFLDRVDGDPVAENWVSTEATGIALQVLLGPLT